MLDNLGVEQLAAVVGPSYGGFRAFVWGIEYPDFVRGLVAALSGLKPPRTLDVAALQARLATHPNWNDGHSYEKGGILDMMVAISAETLRS